MDINAEQKRTITRYLLGEMSGPERSEFEDRYLDDPVLFEELVAVEDEMMRCYVRGRLPEAERTAFERRFLTNPYHHRRVNFARSLMKYAASIHEPSHSRGIAGQGDAAGASHSDTDGQKQKPGRWQRIAVSLAGPGSTLRLATAIALVVLIAGSSWLAVMDTRLRRAFEQMQTQHDTDLRREQELRGQLAALRLRLQQQEQVAHRSSLTIPQFTLTSHLVRQSGPQTPLVIPKGFPQVVLEAILCSNAYLSYSASVETPEGRQIWRQSDLKGLQTRNGWDVIGLILPSRIFNSGNYILKVSGRTAAGKPEEVDSYAFQVVRR